MKYATLALLLTGCGLMPAPSPPASPCDRSTGWNDNHLPHDGLNIRIDDRRSPTQIEIAPVPYAALNGMGTQLSFSPDKGSFLFAIVEGGETTSGFLGRASVSTSWGHISKAKVEMNTSLLKAYRATVVQHVLMQELLHLCGLGHQRNANPPSAMDDCKGRGSYRGWLDCLEDPAGVGPNHWDVARLRGIYEHARAATPSEDPPPGCDVETVVHEMSARWDDHGEHEH